ncbi:hypothetical protein QX776_13240 [Alteromonadaceae bacterium BrNp21-10]|nr:hypothetical protein [Alteromonadaceae bacterium BrNp21-10]
MPLPLFWIGAGVTSVLLGQQFHKENQRRDQRVRVFPGEDKTAVQPIDGSLVSCGIYGLFEHTGIWVDGQIIELKGNGLIRAISPERFLKERSGSTIYVACGADLKPLVSPDAMANAIGNIFHYADYHVLNNNCHRFSWRCLSSLNEPVVKFADLNKKLSQLFKQAVHWQPCLK